MAKIGLNIKIDVTKLDKARFFKGEKGLYLDLTTFLNTDGIGEYGDHGIITQQCSKEERESGMKMPIVGNARIFFSTLKDKEKSGEPTTPPSNQKEYDDDCPF